jgi:CheY-like chemotaxis protein
VSRILVIDDDEIYGELTLQRLVIGGHEAAFQKGPFGTTTMLKKAEYDAVILDVHMPGLSGTSLVDILMKHQDRPRIILCSNIDKDELAELAWDRGVDGWFPKSVTTEELWRVIKTVCAAPVGRR